MYINFNYNTTKKDSSLLSTSNKSDDMPNMITKWPQTEDASETLNSLMYKRRYHDPLNITNYNAFDLYD